MKRLYIIFIFVVSALSLLAQSSVVHVKQEFGSINLSNDFSYLVDTTLNKDIDDIFNEESDFRKHYGDHVNFGYSDYPYWIKIELLNEDKNDYYFLEFNYPHLDSVEIYIPTESGYQKENYGRMSPFYNREVVHKNTIIPILLKSGKATKIFVKFSGESSRQFPPILRSYNNLIRKINIENILFGIYYGIMIAMLLYNFFLWVSIRDKSYLFYVIYILSYLFVQFAYNGFAYQYLWPNYPVWNQISIPVLIAFCMTNIGVFAKAFLHTKRKAPLFNKLLIGLIIIGLSIMLYSMVGDYRIALQSALFLMLLTAILAMISGIDIYRKGYRPARYFIIAWVALVTGLIMLSLKSLTILPNIFITEYGVQIGSAIEVILLSFALADRINIIKQEKEKAQSEAIKNQLVAIERLKEADELKRILNEELEQKVEERSVQILEKNSELEAQNVQITNQSKIINLKNKEIVDSINYAKSIQSSILSSETGIRDLFPDSFVFYQPKETLSGDYYWVEKIDEKQGDIVMPKHFFAAAIDCTGHGVPGALMSIISHSLISQAVSVYKMEEPGEIIMYVDQEIKRVFKNKEGTYNDGMAIALIRYSFSDNTIVFSGASRPLYLVRDGELKTYKGMSSAAGSFHRRKITSMKQEIIHIQPDDHIYLCSDGFSDQFNSKGQKFKSGRFKNMLLDASELDILSQKDYIKKQFFDWKGTSDQIDDVLVMGFMFN